MRLNGFIGLVSGVLLGAAGSWFVTKKIYEKKMAEHDAENRKMFHNLCKDVREGKITPAEIPVNDEKKPVLTSDLTKEELQDRYRQVEEEAAKKDYRVPDMHTKKSYENLLKERNRTLPSDTPNYEEYDPPFEISEQELGVIGHFDEIRLTWFLEDCILCDPRDGRVYDELDEILGSEICDILSDEERLPPVLYIRNPFLGFEIILKIEKEALYAETFLDGGPDHIDFHLKK